jgi:magnesium chelatase family protein
MLVAAMNPCPCGYYSHPERECACGPGIINRYLSRISGPLLDRIDMHLEVVPVPFHQLEKLEQSEDSLSMREQVLAAREVQSERYQGRKYLRCNAGMEAKQRNKYCILDRTGTSLIRQAMKKLGLSARAYDRILKVARTISDLEGSEKIQSAHVAEAINYRNLDREGWSG